MTVPLARVRDHLTRRGRHEPSRLAAHDDRLHSDGRPDRGTASGSPLPAVPRAWEWPRGLDPDLDRGRP